MLADLSILPIGGCSHTSAILARVLTRIQESGLRYQLTPTTTCIEGTWEQVSDVARQCHDLVRKEVPHVVTLLRFEDDAGEVGKLAGNTASVEEKAGREFPVSPGEAMAQPPRTAEVEATGRPVS